MARTLTKDADAVLDYGFNWAPWLDSDTIATSEWDVPEGITEDSDDNTTTLTTVWLSGGTAGETYTLTNTITTAGGRTDERTVHIKVVASR
jgi:hypothetical protein